MKKNILAIGIFILLGATNVLSAQEDRNHGIIWSSLQGLEYEVKAGINIGGTAPLPLPEEIRAIKGYSPNVNLSLEGNVTKWFGKQSKWGIILGLRLENKGMETKARTKNYGMEIIGGGGEKLKGNWTGMVKTKFHGSYFSIPLMAAYKVSPRVRFSAGPYISFMTSGDFSGHVYDGYLRKDNSLGDKVKFEGEQVAPYDFSDDLSTFQWGAQAGVDWRAFKHLNIFADITWGLNDIFKKDFNTVTFAMYPIYLNMGFGYAF